MRQTLAVNMRSAPLAWLLMASVSACGAGASGEDSKPQLFSAETRYADTKAIADDLAASGFACVQFRTDSPSAPSAGCDTQAGHLTLYSEPASQSQERIAALRSNNFSCGQGQVVGAGRYLTGPDWMLVDTAGKVLPALESRIGRQGADICA